ncbi:MAG: extracellular solute-binding protein [Terracidiphilus sp.]
MKSHLKIALTAGGMYDRLYARIPEFERTTGVKVAIEFSGTHPELNAHLAALDHVPYHLVSTHTKYAPSQLRFLTPIENYDTSDFFPAVLDLARIGGALYGIPRNIDLRLLHYRTDIIETPPATWDELVALAKRATHAPDQRGFVFTGMESGLFGTFFELAESAGARIFPASLVPEVNNDGGRWALNVLRELYSSGAVPEAITGWHYDEVHAFFRAGRAAMVFDWPGYYASYRDPSSPVRDRFQVARMPAGPFGRTCCYAGAHTFALTQAGADCAETHELLRFLTAPEQQAIEVKQGSVAVRRSVMSNQRQVVQGDEAHRLALLEHSVEHDLLIPPKLSYYPQIESIVWRNVRAAMTEAVAIADAVVEIERKIEECVTHAA